MSSEEILIILYIRTHISSKSDDVLNEFIYIHQNQLPI